MRQLKHEIIAALSERQGDLSGRPITSETLAQREENFITRDIIKAIFEKYEK